MLLEKQLFPRGPSIGSCMFYSQLFVYFAVSCKQYFEDGYEADGMYRLFVDGPCKRPVKTLCDQSRRFGGGWTLLVRDTARIETCFQQ